MKIIRFLDWRQPLADLVASNLMKFAGEGLPDLSSILLILPGRRAIRVLSEKLVMLTKGGLLAPEFITPGNFLGIGVDNPENRASESEELAAWYQVLSSRDLTEFDKLFPDELAVPDNRLLGQLAGRFQRLRKELAQGGFSLADIAGLPGSGARWQQLAELEQSYQTTLTQFGRIDSLEMDRVTSRELASLTGFERIIVAGVPEFPALVLRRLEAYSAVGNVEVWVHAPQTFAGAFDEWGRPVAQAWEKIGIDEEDPVCFLHKVNTPGEAAILAGALSSPQGICAPDRTAIAIADESFFPQLQHELGRFSDRSGRKLDVYDPAGVPMRMLRLCRLGSALRELTEAGDFDSAVRLFREKDFLDWAAQRSDCSADRLLGLLDEFALAHLPDRIENAIQLADSPLKEIFVFLLDCVARLRTGSFFAELRQLFGMIFNRAEYPPVEGIAFEDEVAQFRTLLTECSRSSLIASLPAAEQFRLFLRELGTRKLYAEHPAPSMSVGGFLELPYLSQINLIICGLNEGLIPESVGGTPFLTDSLRVRFGLRSNRERFARDAFYLKSLLESRKSVGGSVQLIASKFDASGAPMRFSSLLFNGKDSDVLARGELLFADSPPLASVEVHGSGNGLFQVEPMLHCTLAEDGSPVLSVTDFKEYLASPLRWFFGRVEKMEQVDYECRELDARAFGTACHAALERLGKQEFSDPNGYCAALERNLDGWLQEQYADPLPLLVALQRELLLQRLREAAQRLFEENAGFRVLELEYKLGGDAGFVPFAGARIRGRIDRIEVARQGRLLRLIDYKTADTPVKPADAHVHRKRGSKEIDKFLDLQLPLYALLLRRDAHFRELHPEIDIETIEIECGYFSLPKSVTDTKIVLWERDDFDFIVPQVEAVVTRIVGELKQMTAGRLFDAPGRSVRYDGFKSLLLPDVASAVTGIEWIEDPAMTTLENEEDN